MERLINKNMDHSPLWLNDRSVSKLSLYSVLNTVFSATGNRINTHTFLLDCTILQATSKRKIAIKSVLQWSERINRPLCLSV